MTEKESIVVDRITKLLMSSVYEAADSISYDLTMSTNHNVDSIRNLIAIEFLYKEALDHKDYKKVKFEDISKYIYHISKLDFKIRNFDISKITILDYFTDPDHRETIYKIYKKATNKCMRALFAISVLISCSGNSSEKEYYKKLSKKKNIENIDIHSKFAMYIYNSHKSDVDFYIGFNK